MTSNKVVSFIAVTALVIGAGTIVFSGYAPRASEASVYALATTSAQTPVLQQSQATCSHTISIVSAGTPSAIASAASASSQHQVVSYSIPFSVTPSNGTAFIPAHLTLASAPVATSTMQYGIQNGSSFLSNGTGINAVISSTGSRTLAPDANGNYIVPMGQTTGFVLKISQAVTAAGTYRASLVNVPWSAIDATTWTGNSTTGYESYNTNFTASNSGLVTQYIFAQ